MLKKALFIDRDGTIITEPADEQIDSFEKLSFVPGVFHALRMIQEKTDYELVMVSNQDGLGTDSFPENTFWPVHNFIMQTLEGEGIHFEQVLIDRSFPADNLPTRKPGTALLTQYLNGDYDLNQSYVIGDRDTDVLLAHNMGCQPLQIGDNLGWEQIAAIVIAGQRTAKVHRITKETDVYVELNLDGTGLCHVDTGLPFFDHMLAQIAHHGLVDLTIRVTGDLAVDEHHTIEDTAIVLGNCLRQAIGSKVGIERYGYCLPMDDCLCRLALDFGGRPWLVWDASFVREKVGDMPTEMFMHFFKSLSDNALINLNISAEGTNEHHKIEGIFKAFAHALKMAIKRDVHHLVVPTSKGQL